MKGDEGMSQINIAHQFELIAHRLDSLSVLGSVSARALPLLFQEPLPAERLAEIIESDPALSCAVLSLVSERSNYSLAEILNTLGPELIRKAILSVHIDHKADLTKGLLLHSLAVACCCQAISEVGIAETNPRLAWFAGLLHDIGKLAMCQAMPKSFARIVEEARSQEVACHSVEQKYFGADHTVLGKRLAVKWHLPDEIVAAIWLHHSDDETVARCAADPEIVRIVQLADSIAKRCDIGESGSFDTPQLSLAIVESSGVSGAQIEQIRSELPGIVKRRSQALGLDSSGLSAESFEGVYKSFRSLDEAYCKVSRQNRDLQTDCSRGDFLTEFLSTINAESSVFEIAENFALAWQRFFQTGAVCLYLVRAGDPGSLDAAIVENQRNCKAAILDAPSQIPACIEDTGWLFEQLDIDFELSRTQFIPLIADDAVIGGLVFEQRNPCDQEQMRESFESVSSLAGKVFGLILASRNNQYLAESLAQGTAQPEVSQVVVKPEPEVKPRSVLDALAEMAAGAGHELNNPLSVISGRAQMLGDAETEPGKRQILAQIIENAAELSAIIDGLMSFAEPQPPRLTQTNIRQMLDEATQLAAQKTGQSQIDVRMQIDEHVENIFVDSAQMASAIANVFANSLESYDGGNGPIDVTVNRGSGRVVEIQIADKGCGMDGETLSKATQPFFSAKPAGRKRGMGLAYTERLVNLNHGSMKITSQPGAGTTVTILLPCS
ncbi:HDOD domain-containing protein [Planctomycetota bacterium]